MLLPIPDDWDGETWQYKVLCWPCSVQWEAILLGLVTLLQRGRMWDKNTSASPTSIKDIQAIAQSIYENNLDMGGNFMGCQDLVDVLTAIQAAIAGINANQTNQITIQTNIANNVTALATATSTAIADLQTQLALSVASQATAQANAYAWSQAFAQATSPVYVQNNVSLEIRALQPTIEPAPTSEETTQSGITSTLQDDTDTEVCKRVFWLMYAAWKYTAKLIEIRNDISSSTLAVLGGLANALTTAAVTGAEVGIPFVIPAAILLEVAHIYFKFIDDTVFHDGLDAALDVWENNFELMVCEVYQDAIATESTATLQATALAQFISADVPIPVLTILKLILNFNSFAAIYYTTSLIPSLPAIPTEYTGVCDSCGA